MKVVDRALQAHGAFGMTDDTILSYYYRHERAARIYDGPDEVHKSAVSRRGSCAGTVCREASVGCQPDGSWIK